MELIPQSITTAPGLTQSCLTISGLPTATTSISAVRHTAGRLLVLLWQTVTVALFHFSNSATGVPTILLLPRTTAATFPSLTVHRPSTSLEAVTASVTR